MFTGIIQDIGLVIENKFSTKGRLIKLAYTNPSFQSIHPEESIAINGVCLTVVNAQAERNELEVDVIDETLKKTTLKSISPNTKVNLERAITLQDRIGGHIILGHIDHRGKILSIKEKDLHIQITIGIEDAFSYYIVYKGSISLDGISLTISEINDTEFNVSIIPYTWNHTTLKYRKTGDLVNLEFDIIGKYVASYLQKKMSIKNSS